MKMKQTIKIIKWQLGYWQQLAVQSCWNLHNVHYVLKMQVSSIWLIWEDKSRAYVEVGTLAIAIAKRKPCPSCALELDSPHCTAQRHAQWQFARPTGRGNKRLPIRSEVKTWCVIHSCIHFKRTHSNNQTKHQTNYNDIISSNIKNSKIHGVGLNSHSFYDKPGEPFFCVIQLLLQSLQILGSRNYELAI